MTVPIDVDLRCPVNRSRLLARVKRDPAVQIVEGNLVEVACTHCRNEMRRSDPTVLRVLHRFNVLGDLVETETVAA